MPTPQQVDQVEDELDMQINSALEAAGPQAVAEQQTSAREAAELEEKLQAHRLAEIKAINEGGTPPPPIDEEPLISLAAKGREHLLEALRRHAEKPKPVYVPPPITERMQTNINAEMEAGRRRVAEHAAQQAARPVPVREKWDGTNTPVFRPGTVVPDPKAHGQNQFNGPPPTFDPNA